MVKVCFFKGDLHQSLWSWVWCEAIIAVKVPAVFLDLHQSLNNLKKVDNMKKILSLSGTVSR